MTGIPALGSWAVETNYPDGSDAWSGKPLAVLGGIDYFTPNNPVPAEQVNALFQDLYLQDKMLLAAGSPARNWQPAFAPTTDQPVQIVWNGFARTFVVLSNNVSDGIVAQIYLGTDQAVLSTTGTGGALGAHPMSGGRWAACDSAGNCFVFAVTSGAVAYLPNGATAWTVMGLVPIAATSTSAANLATLDAGVLCAFDSTASNETVFAYVTATTPGPAPTPILALSQAPPANGWSVASNGAGSACIVPRASASAYASASVYLVTSSGVTSTTLLTAAGFLAGTDVPIDVVYNGVGWTMAVSHGGGTQTDFWQSTDAVHWTKVASASQFGSGGAAASVLQMVAIGQALAVIASSTATQAPISYSLDGGATWYPSDAYLFSAGGPFGIVAGDVRFAGWTQYASGNVRFSEAAWTGTAIS